MELRCRVFMGLAAPLILLAVAWGLSLWGVPAHDPDLGWHLLGGRWILEHGAVPRADFINLFRREWHDYHWLAQVLLAWVYEHGGYTLLRVTLGLLGVALFLALVGLALRARRGTLSPYTTLIVLSGFVLIQEIATIRPQMLALLLLALASILLVQRPAWFELPVLFVVTVIGVNVHVYWVFIPYLWFLYRVTPRLVRRSAPSSLYAWGGMFLLGGAGLISPYGVWGTPPDWAGVLSNYALVWDYLTMPEVLKNSINELRSGVGRTGWVQLILLSYLAFFSRTARWRRFLADAGAGLAAITGFVLAVLGIKYVAVTAIFVLPYLIRHPLPCTVGRRTFVRPLVVGCLALATVGAYRSWITYPFTHPNDARIDDFVPYSACHALARLPMKQRNDSQTIRVLTHFNHGGWCRWALYESDPTTDYRVTTDNRTQGIPGEHFERSFDLFGAKRGWLGTLAEWDPDVAVVQKDYPLAQFMGLSPDRWRKVFEDNLFVIFVPQS